VTLTSRPSQLIKPTVVPSATAYHDPVWLVRRAWSSHRLASLQAVIRTTIGELQALAPRDLLGKDWAPPELGARLPDPVIEALRACSEELRDASGIAGSQVAREAHCSLVRRYISQQPAAWGKTFAAALDQYRHAACRVLLAAFPEDSRQSALAT
jgi:hypothetical protein